MPAFIEARTDPFAARREQAAQDIRQSGRDFSNVRRPTRGFEIKPETYAIIRVALRDGTFLPVIDAAGEIVNTQDSKGYTTQYSNFIISTVQEDRREKQQIVESFGDTYIFFFGESPRVYNISGLLLNTQDFNWRAEWWENYERYFRGTRLVEYNARLYLIYDDIILEGYMLGAQAVENADNPYVLQLNFQLFVTGYTNVSLIGDPNFPRPANFVDTTQPSEYDATLAEYQRSMAARRELTGDAAARASNSTDSLGQRTVLTDSLRLGLTQDAGLSSFLRRAEGAISPARETSPGQRSTLRPMPTVLNRRIRTTFRDNVDEFVARQEPSEEELAAPLNMADRWVEFDRKADNILDELGYEPSNKAVSDVLGRNGRSLSSMGKNIGPRAPNTAMPSYLGRTIRPRGVREVPFGLTAILER